jgi:hypothetical protein
MNLAGFGVGACSVKAGAGKRGDPRGDPDFEEVAWYGTISPIQPFSLNVFATVKNARVLLANFPFFSAVSPGQTYGPFSVIGNACEGFDIEGVPGGGLLPTVPILSTRDPHTNLTIYVFADQPSIFAPVQMAVTAVAFGKESTNTSSAIGGPSSFPPIDPRSVVTASATAALNTLLQTSTIGGPLTITLPTTGPVSLLPASRQPYVIYLTDVGFDNATNPVTVQVGAGWQVQDPQTNLLSAAGGFVTLANNGATTGWYASPTSSTTGVWYALF